MSSKRLVTEGQGKNAQSGQDKSLEVNLELLSSPQDGIMRMANYKNALSSLHKGGLTEISKLGIITKKK